MTGAHLKALEDEVKHLTKLRSQLFNEWASLVKKNDIDFELYGSCPPEKVKEAKELLEKQKTISKKIMKLLKRINNLHLTL